MCDWAHGFPFILRLQACIKTTILIRLEFLQMTLSSGVELAKVVLTEALSLERLGLEEEFS